jgi:hypothetical protein
MVHIQDRWERMIDGERVRTARYGKGKRWQARYRDPDGHERTKDFARKATPSDSSPRSPPTSCAARSSTPTPAR